MRVCIRWWLIGWMALLMGCQRSAEQEVHQVPDTPLPMPVYFQPMASAVIAGTADTLEIVVYDRETWKQWQASFPRLRLSSEPDFHQAMLILIAIPRLQAGHRITVETVEETTDSLQVTYTLTEPASDCMVADVPTVALQVVMARRVEKPVRFKRHVDYESCDV